MFPLFLSFSSPNHMVFENEVFTGHLIHLQLSRRKKSFGVWKPLIWTWFWHLLVMQVAWLLGASHAENNFYFASLLWKLNEITCAQCLINVWPHQMLSPQYSVPSSHFLSETEWNISWFIFLRHKFLNILSN